MSLWDTNHTMLTSKLERSGDVSFGHVVRRSPIFWSSVARSAAARTILANIYLHDFDVFMEEISTIPFKAINPDSKGLKIREAQLTPIVGFNRL